MKSKAWQVSSLDLTGEISTVGPAPYQSRPHIIFLQLGHWAEEMTHSLGQKEDYILEALRIIISSPQLWHMYLITNWCIPNIITKYLPQILRNIFNLDERCKYKVQSYTSIEGLKHCIHLFLYLLQTISLDKWNFVSRYLCVSYVSGDWTSGFISWRSHVLPTCILPSNK